MDTVDTKQRKKTITGGLRRRTWFADTETKSRVPTTIDRNVHGARALGASRRSPELLR